LGLHNPLAAALGANGEKEMVLAKQVLAAQPERSLMINDRYYGVADVLVDLPATGQRHFLMRVRGNLNRRLGAPRWQAEGFKSYPCETWWPTVSAPPR